jgi:hypothetical protein
MKGFRHMVRMAILALVLSVSTIATVEAAGGLSAQASANASAASGRMAHRGGSFRYEGVGFSTRSAQDAIHNCCFWGKRTPVEIAVSRGRNGWFACVRYR